MEPSEIFRLTTDIQDDLTHNMRLQLVFDDINFTGALSKSINQSHDGRFHTIEVTSPYAKFVEYGMPPGHKVSYWALFKWVQGKLLISDKKEARDVTFKIRSKILGEGIKPKRFMKKAILRLGRYNNLVAQRTTVRTNRQPVNNNRYKLRNTVRSLVKMAKLIKNI